MKITVNNLKKLVKKLVRPDENSGKEKDTFEAALKRARDEAKYNLTEELRESEFAGNKDSSDIPADRAGGYRTSDKLSTDNDPGDYFPHPVHKQRPTSWYRLLLT